jgi:hypothetical protein
VEPTSMVAAAGWLPLLVTGVPQEAWGLAGAWPVPCGAGAQAPVCRAGVFLLTGLKLWDLEHTLGCGLKMIGSQGAAGMNRGRGQGTGSTLVPSPTLESPSPLVFWALCCVWPAKELRLSAQDLNLPPGTCLGPGPSVVMAHRSYPKPDLEAPDPGPPPRSSTKGARP